MKTVSVIFLIYLYICSITIKLCLFITLGRKKNFSYTPQSILSIFTVLQTQVFKVRQVDEPCIGLTQENLIEFLLQSSLSYIPFGNGSC